MNIGYMNTGITSTSTVRVGAIITLPPGSTSADLQAAVNGAISGDVIVISGDMPFASAVAVPLGLSITIQSSAGNNWAMTATAPGFRHFVAEGNLLLNNVTLDGDADATTSVTRGGVQVQASGLLTMGASAVIRDCYAGLGGGVYVTGGGMNMESGSILNNRAGAGGGVYITAEGILTLSGGTVSGNASTYGGGVYINTGSQGAMTGGVIGGSTASEANTASAYGGGVAVYRGSGFVLDGGTIEGNRMESDSGGGGGGGVYVIDNSTFELRSGTIRNNTATAGTNWPSFGGGVMLGELTYVVPPGLAPPSTLLMSGGSIEGNDAGYRGGGVSVVANCNFTMTGGTIRGNTATTNENGGGGGVHIGAVLEVTGVTFTMDGGVITENAGFIGGGVLILGSPSGSPYIARFIMNSGEITQNVSAATYGGGVCALYANGEFIMGDAAGGFTAPLVSGNRSNTDGGGVYANMAPVTINGGILSGNEANSLGGGICLAGGSIGTMREGLIDGNTAGTSGGGIAIVGASTALTMESVNVTGNTAGAADSGGGGIYVGAAGTLTVFGASFIAGNGAPNGSGGGIYTANFDYGDPANPAAYANIVTDAETVFSDNTALAAYVPPSNANSFAGIGYAETSISDVGGYVHPLNNYDINYVGATELILYRVMYSANGGTGGYLVTGLIEGSIYTVLSIAETGISRGGYTFTGWNTAANGTGVSYRAGDMIAITGDVTLYAQWMGSEIPSIPPCCISCCKPCGKQCYGPFRNGMPLSCISSGTPYCNGCAPCSGLGGIRPDKHALSFPTRGNLRMYSVPVLGGAVRGFQVNR